ncbi:glycosyltransferase family 4 protein [Pseudorhodoferax sp.]|uniref:glycosyltransferase family 4 protein n=1 Tax=Pseudorhodoferax sp. TaxID=1993553 RepID=UPI002DD69882|nr:glycosyltransferase [Pseudorhodoferax sp.]
MFFVLCLSFAIALFSAMLVVRRARGHAGRYGYAKPQRFHVGDVPRLGGVAIASGMVAAWGAAVIAHHFGGNAGNLYINGGLALSWFLVLLPAFAGGVIEDFTQRLHLLFRLGLTGVSAGIAVLLLDVAVPRLGVEWVDALLATSPWLGMAVAFIAITGLPHAFNIIDGYNGLAGMVALIVSLALIYVALQVGDRQLAGLLVCMTGATGGFLVWNYPRGMVFAGDCGAYVWGITIALGSLVLVQRHAMVSAWFPMLLLIYPVWETLFSMYRKTARGVSPGVADALHFHQLVYRRIVHGVFHDDESRRVLMRNNRTSPYLWAFTMLTVAPAVLFWRNTPVLMAFCALFVVSYVAAYLMIIRFKVPRWLRK